MVNSIGAVKVRWVHRVFLTFKLKTHRIPKNKI